MEKKNDDEFTFTWIIENFSMCHQPKGDYLRSPPFVSHSLPGFIWRILLYPQGNLNETYVAIFIRRDDDFLETCSLKLNIEGRDGNEKFIFRITEQTNVAAIEGTERWGSAEAFDRKSLFESLINDILIIKCTLQPVCEVYKKEVLSCRNEVLTDVVLRSGNSSFKVHKAILWARWPKLAEKLDAEETNEQVFDIESYTLNAMIDYVYTGKVDCRDSELLVKLHSAAAKYEFLKLQALPIAQKGRTRINVQKMSFEFSMGSLRSWPRHTIGGILYSQVFSVDICNSCKWHLNIVFNKTCIQKSMHCMQQYEPNYEISLYKLNDNESNPVFVRSKLSLDGKYVAEYEHLYETNKLGYV
ncbi:Protein roadkill, partial [Stegodyphus mimosarum]